jgi:hypothetical protein
VRTDIDWPDAAAAVHCNAPRGKTLREGQESNVRSAQAQSLSFARVGFLRVPHWVLGSVQESVRDPDFSGVGRCRCQQPVVVAVEMWEPAFGAGFQSRWDGQQSSAKIPLSVRPSVISTANSEFRPFCCACCRWRNHKTKMCVSRTPRRINTITDCRASLVFEHA